MHFFASSTLLFTLVVTVLVKPAVQPNAIGLFNINDFQGYGLNLISNVNPAEGTAVVVAPGTSASALNQEWSLISKGGSIVWIASGLNSSLFLSYPSASRGGFSYGSELIASSQFPANFSLQAVTGTTFKIIEWNSRLALTSWKAVPGSPAAPAIFVELNDNLAAQQTWSIVAAPLV
ncbi:hypothetical protein R3P38DRAFT_3177436 [Favolaschia claudopus]|uniref:Ricin B lectin domain-containing protein n=1 Tax=Favolaschia claudopus TaxID=2862362 RepID=A0AAW0D3U4_9AGAR